MALRLSLFTILTLSFSIAAISCSGTRSGNPGQSDQASKAQQAAGSDAADERIGQQRRQGQSYVTGRGLGRNSPFRGGSRGRARYGAISFSREEREAIQIETTKPLYRSVRALHSAMGKVLAPKPRMAQVSYAFPARISAIHVQIGDWVEKGQPAITLQSEEVGRAKSEYYKAIADRELAKANYEREKRLFDRGAGAQKNALSAEAEYKVAQTNLDAAEKKLHVLGFSEEEVKLVTQTHQISPSITIFAPIRGKVIEHNAVLGEMIDQSTQLLTILDPAILWVDAEIFERDLARIRVGQQVQVSVPAYPGETFTGKLSYISDILKSETQTITVRTEVTNRDFKLKPGMFADVNIFLSEQHKVLVVPDTAIIDDQNEQIVFLKVGDQFVPQVVQVGTKQNGYSEVVNGLREADEVVTRGSFQLKSKLYDELLKQAGVR